MTVDELVDLTEALFEEIGFSLESLRLGLPEPVGCLTDEQFLLAVRFLAGERPPQARITPTPTRPVISEDEAARRLAELEELDEVLGPIEIGEGITLL